MLSIHLCSGTVVEFHLRVKVEEFLDSGIWISSRGYDVGARQESLLTE